MTKQLFIDADACPVKEEAIRVATRYGWTVALVSNQGMRPHPQTNVMNVVVGSSFDAADDWIVEQLQPGDVVVTSDIPLAGRCLQKGGAALKPNGQPFTGQNIGTALALRELNSYLREAGEISGHNAAFTKKDRSQFLQALDRMLSQI